MYQTSRIVFLWYALCPRVRLLPCSNRKLFFAQLCVLVGDDSCRVLEKVEQERCDFETFSTKTILKFGEMSQACSLDTCTEKCLEVLEG